MPISYHRTQPQLANSSIHRQVGPSEFFSSPLVGWQSQQHMAPHRPNRQPHQFVQHVQQPHTGRTYFPTTKPPSDGSGIYGDRKRTQPPIRFDTSTGTPRLDSHRTMDINQSNFISDLGGNIRRNGQQPHSRDRQAPHSHDRRPPPPNVYPMPIPVSRMRSQAHPHFHGLPSWGEANRVSNIPPPEPTTGQALWAPRDQSPHRNLMGVNKPGRGSCTGSDEALLNNPQRMDGPVSGSVWRDGRWDQPTKYHGGTGTNNGKGRDPVEANTIIQRVVTQRGDNGTEVPQSGVMSQVTHPPGLLSHKKGVGFNDTLGTGTNATVHPINQLNIGRGSAGGLGVDERGANYRFVKRLTSFPPRTSPHPPHLRNGGKRVAPRRGEERGREGGRRVECGFKRREGVGGGRRGVAPMVGGCERSELDNSPSPVRRVSAAVRAAEGCEMKGGGGGVRMR
eukprot:GHVN01090695.1.p1 GENE.GHVN01090695.1~~GHVN01090695.1.p1  ORF type:complete len:469 (+),score=136.56 GHVN01090695.1:58-1407(+)